jgi:hypothetical protein
MIFHDQYLPFWSDPKPSATEIYDLENHGTIIEVKDANVPLMEIPRDPADHLLTCL